MGRLRIGVAVAVTIVWAVGYLLSFFAGTAQPVTVTPVMLAVVGWLFAQELREQVRQRVKPKPKPPKEEPDE